MCLVYSALFCSAGLAFSDEFTGYGELVFVSSQSRTAVVDITGNGDNRILGGKLAPDAILQIDDHATTLASFNVGDWVKVVWKHTRYGKEILFLSKKSASPDADPELSKATESTTSVPPATLADNEVREDSSTLSAINTFKFAEWPSAPIIGHPIRHTVSKNETLLDIARNYGLGFNELADLYPDIDPWLPPVGRQLHLPTERIVPSGFSAGIVVNIAEIRLYHLLSKGNRKIIRTYPVSIGQPPFTTPIGSYTIANKVTRPTWHIPPSLRDKYTTSSMPPGPQNPLGKYWLGLKGTMLGIHGTDFAWSIGRTVTHGCIRMYPEEIDRFYPTISLGTKVHLIYEPVKLARFGDKILIEVHRDIYKRHANLFDLAYTQLTQKGLWSQIDREKLKKTLQEAQGIPVNISQKR